MTEGLAVTDDGCHRDLTLPLSLSPYLDLNIAISISVSVYLCLSQRAFAVTDDGCHRDLTLPLSLSLSLYLNIAISIPVSVSVSASHPSSVGKTVLLRRTTSTRHQSQRIPPLPLLLRRWEKPYFCEGQRPPVI